jgi:choline dehydrogenase-like flavoprotein
MTADSTAHSRHLPLVSPLAQQAGMRRYRPADEVDFVIVGSGAAGGVMARELSRNGFSVVVLEQGPWLTERDFSHDEFWGALHPEKSLTNLFEQQPGSAREKDTDEAKPAGWNFYGRCVGGGSLHFTANYWRFPEIEFEQATKLGVPDGSTIADWPITYADLEPYYTKVEWDIGVSGLAGNPFEPPRSKPFPMPPLPIKSEGVLLEKATKALGYHAWPAPMAIASRPYKGRSGCVACGVCIGAACEVRAKSSTAVTMIPEAVATGRCEIRSLSYARKLEVDADGRVTGVTYFDKDKKEVTQRAKAVVLSANGCESPKLLLMSASNQFPNGLANSSGQVGRHIMFNGSAGAFGVFEHEINGWKGAVVSRVFWDTYVMPKESGIYGGGGFDFRCGWGPLGGGNTFDGEPTWGSAWKKNARKYFSHAVGVYGHMTSLPTPNNRMDLDPKTKDAWGLPIPRLTFKGHPNDSKLGEHFGKISHDLLIAAGAEKATKGGGGPDGGGPHLLGTCRMGNDPRTSVVNADHRAHDVKNLFIVDGSNLVTSGRGQPTMTIQALAFRAADRITALVKRNEI